MKLSVEETNIIHREFRQQAFLDIYYHFEEIKFLIKIGRLDHPAHGRNWMNYYQMTYDIGLEINTHYNNLRLTFDELKDKVYKRIFKNQLTEELIAAAMHPRRIQAQMDQFEDIEEYFEAMW